MYLPDDLKEGEIRPAIIPNSGYNGLSEQVEDINSAITFLQLQENVDHNRIGLLGWGMGASNVIQVAAKK
ncbi:hypothetical protein [Scopulibacillus darangshiensis]|uniref:hypothetical protein n=1 Tax=Scopulibacillus darangshiensis TaxID=442528 RepID=UPI001043D0EF|nr:hypothetical protein [Scopulibacillus darangshiensis]